MGLPRIAAEYIAKNGMSVIHGSFRGLSYPAAISTGSVLVPKLLGSYEAELIPTWESLLQERYDTIIDIGCAEGFYAVGLARRMPSAHVFAYDTDPQAQILCQKMIEHNGVADSVTVRGQATAEEFRQVMIGRTLILCDCDGAETDVLNPVAVVSMQTANILVEVHDHLDESISSTLTARFAPTHSIEYIPSMTKDPAQYRELDFFIPENRAIAINEFRPQQGWLVMRAKRKNEDFSSDHLDRRDVSESA